jgi:hypothetical protein
MTTTLDSSNINIGCKYSKKDFGIKFFMKAVYPDHAKGEFFVFFNLGGDFDNKLDANGLTIELRNPTDWKAATPVKTERQHVFVRVGDTGKFTYIGVSERQVLDEKTDMVQLYLDRSLVPQNIWEELTT